MDNFLNMRRFFLLIRNEVLSDYKSWLIYLITIVGIYTGISLIEGLSYRFSSNFSDLSHFNYLFPGFLFLGGYIATSMTFEDANDKFKSSLYFSLPGSALEKYGVGVLVSGIGYVLFIIGAFIIASVVSNVFTRPIFGFGVEIFNPFTIKFWGANGISIWWLAVYYLLTHSIFLVGSLSFRKAAFIKTVLLVFAVQLAYSVIFSILGFAVTKSGIAFNWDYSFIMDFFSFNMGNAKSFFLTSSILTGFILSVFFNVVGYLKLREKEVKGGV